MADQTTERSIERYGTIGTLHKIPLAASAKLWHGQLVACDSSGNLKNTADGDTVLAGVLIGDTQDNTGGSAGAKFGQVEKGAIYPFGNSTSGDAITNADRFKTVYVKDNQTLAKTSNSSARTLTVEVQFVGADGRVWAKVG